MSDPQGYTILFFICLTSVALLRAILKKTRPTSPRRLPPRPPALPIIGHLHLLGPIPHQSFHKLSTRYGPLVHLSLGSAPCIVASSPEVAKEFLKTHESSFSNRPKSAAADYLTYGSQDFTFAPYGPHWKFMKKVCMSELLGGRTLELLLPVKRDEVELFVDSLFRKAKAGEAVDVGAELTRVTNNVISRMVMRKRCSEDEDEAREVRELVKETIVLLGRFNVSDFIWFCKNLDVHGLGKRMRDVHHRLDEMLERIIKEHEGARKKNCDTVKDLLDILLDIKENDNSENKLSKENIKGFILNALVGGTDTSSLTIEWALAELINHPNIMEKAKKEIDAVVGKNRLVEESDIAKLPYLQAIVKETLRLHPSGPVIGRESSEDCTIMGYHIPAKTRLFVNVWAIGRDPNHWDNPLEFRPERFFVEGSEKGLLDVRGQYFHLLPFGTGRRGCPGISLALQVVQTTLAAMIQCFDWKIINGDGGKGLVDMEEKPGFTLLRAHPLVCVPVARLSPFHQFNLLR